jgi:hypothetical protein
LVEEAGETVGNGSRNHFVKLDHRAEAAVLMRSLRVPSARQFHNPNSTITIGKEYKLWIAAVATCNLKVGL